MGSTFGGVALFDSGPHRFVEGVRGRLLLPPFSGPNPGPSTDDRGVRELTVVQTGRLVAQDDGSLWALIDAIRVEAETRVARTLIDHSGRLWTGLELVRFEMLDGIDRGRRVSVAYECVYLR